MTDVQKVKLFKFWLDQGFEYRCKTNKFMQANPQAYRDRLEMEYGAIEPIPGFVDYFLLVSDIVRWAKDNGILVGPGRGSAAGALLCYVLRITEIDPLQYPMLFERFISTDRADLPDIDIDFEDERRWEVIEYAQKKYGYDRVANIINFVRYKGANSLDDIARVYHIAEWKIKAVKERLVERQDGHPREFDTLEDTTNTYDDVAEIFRQDPELEYAKRLESNYRHSAIHPCGIVIAGDVLTKYAAMYEKQSGSEENQGSGIAYDKKDCEYLGLLKVDFLSLNALTGIRATLDVLPMLDRIGMTIEQFYQIPLDDPKVYEAFRRGDVLGIFQFEGAATKRVLKAVAPTKFMDLVDVNALSRPGGDDKAYIEAKRSGKQLDLHPILEQHISWTQGTIVYQEQILLILRDLGNFPAEAVNKIRKIISAKQDSSVFNEYLERFVDGAATHGMAEDDARSVWRQMVNATGYAFNISHAVCYSDIAYRQMWLKVHYPHFYLGQLSKCPETDPGREKRRKLIIEASRKGITVRPPDINLSELNWSLYHRDLYAGFTIIKGIGGTVGNKLVAWRNRLRREALGIEPNDERLLRGVVVPGLEWSRITEVPGIGRAKVDAFESFCYSDDPFEVGRIKRVLDAIRDEFDRDMYPGMEPPSHTSLDITTPDEFVTFIGIPKDKVYKDVVEQRIKYGEGDQTEEEILASLDDPNLRKYAALTVEDEHDEPVKVRIGRKKYPQYKRMLSNLQLGYDVVWVEGYVSDFGGTAIQIKDMMVIKPPTAEEDK